MKQLSVAVGTYMSDGEQKTKWRNVGVLIENDKGPVIKLDATFNPAGLPIQEDGSVYINIFDKRERQESGSSQGNYQRDQYVDPTAPAPF